MQNIAQVSCPSIELGTLRFAAQHSDHWATGGCDMKAHRLQLLRIATYVC